MEIIFGLLLLLVATRAFGEGASRLKLPASVGELLAGAVLAVLIFGFGDLAPGFERIARSDELALVAQAGIFFLVLQAGIDLKPLDIARQSKSSLWIAVGGALIPFGAGMAFGYFVLPESDLKFAQSFFVGVAISITAIPATVKVLDEQGALGTRFGQAIVAAAIFDDVFGLFLLAILTSLITSSEPVGITGLTMLVGQVALFFGVTVPVGVHIYPRVVARLKTLQVAAAEFSILMMVALAYGLFAELLGLHWIMGAFMAGLFFEPERVGARAYNEMRIVVVGITGGFLGPLFFASIGLEINFLALITAPFLVVALIALAFLGKFVGAGVPALWQGFSKREAAAIGTGMSARGAVELVVISVAMDAGLFAGNGEVLISALIVTAVVTTFAAPLVLRGILSKLGKPD